MKSRMLDRRALIAAGLPLALAACAPVLQTLGAPGSDFAGPSLQPDGFVSIDGAKLGLTVWPAEGDAEPWAVIVGLHGMNDYANAFHLAAPVWARQGIATYAYDQRGFGRSPNRGVWPGKALMVEDLRAFTALVRRRHPKAILAVVGESMGGAAAIAAFASDRPPDADRLILLSPAVWGWSNQPLPYKTMLWLAAHAARSLVVTPPSFITSKVRASDNTPELIRMGRDPLMIWGARFDALYGLVDLMEAGWRDIGALSLPAAYLYGAHDEIIPEHAAFTAAARLKPPGRTLYYKRGWHLLLRDIQAQVVYDDVVGLIRDPAAPPVSGAPPIPFAKPTSV
jgi:acylglycerol lipase